MIKQFVRKSINLLGFDLTRLPDQESIEYRKEARLRRQTLWLQRLQIETIFDIGANTGEWALWISKVIPDATIYCFEPIPQCFREIQQNLVNQSKFFALNIALGNDDGEFPFEFNQYTGSSSFRKMTETHTEAFPFTANRHTISVQMKRLDDVVNDIAIIDPLFVKIDVQGFEDQVLLGGELTIKQAKVILIESSFTHLYTGQILFEDLYHTLSSWGFVYHGAFEQILHPQDRLPLQQDSIFIRMNET